MPQAASVSAVRDERGRLKHQLRPSRDLDRVDLVSGVSSRRTGRPILRGGRPNVARKLAFAHLEPKPAHQVGAPSRLAELTEADMRIFEQMCSLGVTPHIAAIKCLEVPYDTFARWRRDGEREDCQSAMKRAFYLRVEKAYAIARETAEKQVLAVEPRYFLTQGPAGRTLPNRPGWTEEKVHRFADETGDGPPRFILRIEASGFRTEAVVAPLPALTEENS